MFQQECVVALPRKIIEHIDSREENDVVLGPQRRSFQGGCHVASKEKPSTSYSRSVSSSSKLSGNFLNSVVMQFVIEVTTRTHLFFCDAMDAS